MDLQWTQATWNKFFQRIGLPASVYFLLRRVRDELRDEAVRIEEYYDPDGHLSGWSLEGVNLFENTDESGLLYVKTIDAGGGDWTVELYKDSGLTSKVAEGTTVSGSMPEDLTLAEANDSGITGQVTVTAAVAAGTDIWLRPRVGLLKQINDVPVDDIFDANYKVDLNRNLATIITTLANAMTRIEAFVKSYAIPYIGEKIQTSESQAQLSSESSSGGNISYVNNGILLALIDAMNDDTIAGAQTIETPADTGSVSSSADADNVGQGDLDTGNTVMFEYAEDFLATFECNVATIGSETFNVVARNSRGERITAKNVCTVYKDYLSTDIGIKYTKLLRTISDSGAESDHFSNWIVYGVTANNSDGGVLYCTISGTGTVVDFYSDSGRTTKVAEGAIAAGVLTISEYDDSGISGTADVTGTPADGNGLAIDINPFSIGDKIYLTFSRSEHSFFELLFGIIMKTELPFDAVASTIKDAYANRGFEGLDTVL